MLWASVALALFGQTVAAANPRSRWGGAAKILMALGLLAGLTFAASSIPSMGSLTIAQATLIAAAGLCLGAQLLASIAAKKPAGNATPVDVCHLFFLSALNWLVLATVADLVVQIRQYRDPGPTLEVQTILFSVYILGFAGNLVLGISARALPTLLATARLRDRAWLLTGLLWNGGLLLTLLAGPIGPTAAVAGFLAMLAAAAFFLLGLDFLRSNPAKIPAQPAKCLVALAFLALAAGLALLAAPKTGLIESISTRFHIQDSAKHLLMVGFLGMLALAITGSPTRLVAATLLVGLALRTLGPWLTTASPAWPNAIIAAGAILELFAWTLWAATRARRTPTS